MIRYNNIRVTYNALSPSNKWISVMSYELKVMDGIFTRAWNWLVLKPNNYFLISDTPLSASDFWDIGHRTEQITKTYRKIAFVEATQTDTEMDITTFWNGTETVNMTSPGDWIVTNLDKNKNYLLDKDGNRNRYVISKEKFPSLYKATGEPSIYRSNSMVVALYFRKGFLIQAPWNEVQNVSDGYLVFNIVTNDVYGNAKETFESTFEPVF